MQLQTAPAAPHCSKADSNSAEDMKEESHHVL